MGKSIIIKGADFSANAIKSQKWNIVYNVTNTSLSAMPVTIGDGNTLRITFSEVNGYGLPLTVSVTNTITGQNVSGASYNANTGLFVVKGVTENITIAAEGAEDTSAHIVVTPSTINISAETNSQGTASFVVTGIRLTGGVTLTLVDQDGKFALSKTTLTKQEAENGATITVTYNGDSDVATHEASVLVASESATSQYVSVSAESTLPQSGIFVWEPYGGYWSTGRQTNTTFVCNKNLLPKTGAKIKFFQSDGTTILDKKLKVGFYNVEDLSATNVSATDTKIWYSTYDDQHVTELVFPEGTNAFAFTAALAKSDGQYTQMTQEEAEGIVVKWYRE